MSGSSDGGWRLRGHFEFDNPMVELWALASFFHLEVLTRGLLLLPGGPLVMSPKVTRGVTEIWGEPRPTVESQDCCSKVVKP